MAKKKKTSHPTEVEPLYFDEVKELTIDQIERKQEEIKAGIEEGDGVLDRYIKQHREAIEAEKFDTLARSVTLSNAVDTQSEDREGLVEDSKDGSLKPLEMDLLLPVEDTPDFYEEETSSNSKKKAVIWTALGFVLMGLLVTAFIGLRSVDQTNTQHQTETSQSSKASVSDAQNEEVSAFNALYARFFTDSSLSSLKNEMFSKLPELKAALEKISASASDYKTAKAKYDALEKAIQAIQAVNSQFDKPVIVDGELDKTATVKESATFVSTSTGISAVDRLLTSAINYGNSQLPSNMAGKEEPINQEPSTPLITQEPPIAAASPATLSNGLVLHYGKRIVFGSEDVSLQRELSRVPYNDAAIADAANDAWVFTAGVLEGIVATSNQRGYFAGNDFILEKVNIINGNGYYNLFRSDGTYLFSINAKTGYFVGNGSGYADALDF